MKHLLPTTPFYKANLHCHSNVDDGKLSPAELKERYQKLGYSVLALTDHETCFTHQELTDENFVVLTGYEMLTNQWDLPFSHSKTYHFNFIAKDPNNRWQIYNPKYRPKVAKYADQIVCDGFEEREYDLEQMNRIIARANEKGFLVTYNHPIWSMQQASDYLGLKGIWAVEVFNSECYLLGYDSETNHVYQEMLKEGNRLFPIAVDDTHTPRAIGMGWIMIGAEKLDYRSVIAALERGDFYASTGPEIYSLTFDRNVLRVTCSDAATIHLQAHCRMGQRVIAQEGVPLCEAEFDLTRWIKECMPEWEDRAFVRICVTDRHGNKAYTRAYWRDEIL